MMTHFYDIASNNNILNVDQESENVFLTRKKLFLSKHRANFCRIQSLNLCQFDDIQYTVPIAHCDEHIPVILNFYLYTLKPFDLFYYSIHFS